MLNIIIRNINANIEGLILILVPILQILPIQITTIKNEKRNEERKNIRKIEKRAARKIKRRRTKRKKIKRRKRRNIRKKRRKEHARNGANMGSCVKQINS